MNAILVIDLETWVFAIFLHNLIDASRAIALRWFIPHRQVHGDRNARILELQMRGFIFFMAVAEKATLVRRSKEITPSGLG